VRAAAAGGTRVETTRGTLSRGDGRGGSIIAPLPDDDRSAGKDGTPADDPPQARPMDQGEGVASRAGGGKGPPLDRLEPERRVEGQGRGLVRAGLDVHVGTMSLRAGGGLGDE